ncbi:glycosyltransferase family 4 protein [Patescibacteria group bacterium]|nr:glycosyltransferase family 4 protein [Patescibacteria group bacterium]
MRGKDTKTMLIGIDARFFGPKAKGLGRYAQKLIERLEQTDKQNDYLVFLRRANFDEYQPQNPRFKKILAPYRWYSIGEQLFFPFKLYQYKINLMHFTHFNAPMLYFKPYVVTIHDLILQRFPTVKDTLFGRVKYFLKNIGYKIVIHLVVNRAKKIIAISRFVKNDIIKSFGVAEEKISVIYEGAPARFASQPACQAERGGQGESVAGGPEESSRQILVKYGIKKPYLLYVGNAYPQKNLARLIEAFKILVEGGYNDLRLALVGEKEYFYRKLREQSESIILQSMVKKDQMVFTGFVPDEELGALYQNASIYVFPSLCEGFGLPPLEAMARGAPVVSSNATCLPEILGQAAHYFDAASPADMAAKISEVLTDESLRQKLIVAGFEQIKKYSWQRMAEETQKIYVNCARC